MFLLKKKKKKKKNNRTDIIEELNSIEQKIKFILKIEKESTLNYLDVKNTRMRNLELEIIHRGNQNNRKNSNGEKEVVQKLHKKRKKEKTDTKQTIRKKIRKIQHSHCSVNGILVSYIKMKQPNKTNSLVNT